MSPRVRPLTALAVLVLAATSACGQSTPDTGGSAGSTPSGAMPSASTAPTSQGTPTPSPSGSVGGQTIPPDLLDRPAVESALDDAADRQSVSAGEVIVAAFTPVTWNDGSLGCPQKGMSYTQMTVEGELLILRVGTTLLQYHGRVGGPYTYCANPTSGYSVGG